MSTETGSTTHWNPASGYMGIQFTVFGKPVPQGSTRAFIPKGWNRAVITSDNRGLKPWRQQISQTADSLGVTPFPKDAAVSISLDFYFTKPQSAPKRRIYPTVKPDIDKLVRAILDACSGILFVDDSQVVRFDHIEKHYGQPERVEIRIQEVQ